MTMMRDYSMFTYEIAYIYTFVPRDGDGEVLGVSRDALMEHTPVVVARSQAIADAWVQEQFNASYQNHRNFEMRLVNRQSAPHLILEMPY